ncbi:Ubiquinone biosynthesis O-methyltransferase [Mycolicibacterium vanbaalenii]|uniref:Ubiquinone biosynthesis O-methyltransferase n=1 Tax=Mycolicibacterium vanbaalenii TaxID=110539 RepID=A0A5S9MU44_MYCVN|nr:class I SAM-dependent methyltransferase [Mycolicibacterium vanbaalenii]CAA0080854.1 Ubiquinone biosynthesis O-methyltransferase [Mycolicibacterium vanbaalenii]
MTGSSDAANALADEWDERYTSLAAEIPDGAPSAVLMAVAGELAPGRALEIGCGVGADAVWLAGQGWEVTALDVSRVALERARSRGRQAGVHVQWVCARLEDAELSGAGFDLVTAHYPALRHSPGHDAQKALLAAVAPGGTLLVVHHADIDVEKARSYGFDPADYLSHDDVAAMLGDEWDISIQRRRPREEPAGLDGQHTHDDVVRALRRRT